VADPKLRQTILSLSSLSGGNTSSSTLDNRANALARAINSTGMQTLNPNWRIPPNVCTAAKAILAGYAGAGLAMRLGLLPRVAILAEPYVAVPAATAGLVLFIGCS
jgi:anti-sigma-K factor RskA